MAAATVCCAAQLFVDECSQEQDMLIAWCANAPSRLPSCCTVTVLLRTWPACSSFAAMCCCCLPAPPTALYSCPAEVPQAAAHLEVRVLHRLCPGGVSSAARCSYTRTGAATPAAWCQQWLACAAAGGCFSDSSWRLGVAAAATTLAWLQCSGAVCGACNKKLSRTCHRCLLSEEQQGLESSCL